MRSPFLSQFDGFNTPFTRNLINSISIEKPYYVSIIGDSFGQRGQDIVGSPNSLDAGVVDPQTLKWATNLTSRVGGVQWGFSSWLSALSGGKFTAPYQLNRAIGGFNTGQWARFDGADPTPWYLSDYTTFLASAGSTVFGRDVVIYQCGTNDGVTVFTPAQSYANVLKTCQKITDLGIPVFVSTVLPRGNSAFPASRFIEVPDGRITWCNSFNSLLVANLASEPSLNNRCRVIDQRSSFYDSSRTIGTSTELDVKSTLTYDGLHLNPDGCRILALSYLTALNAFFPSTIINHLPSSITYVSNGLMSGTTGTVTRTGNAASNTGFTISGTAPTSWTVTTSLNGPATAWNGTSPNNITGTVVAGTETAAVGNAITLSVNCNGSGLTNANTRALESFCLVTLPDVSVLAVGEYFEGLAVVELSGHSGIRGVSAELRVTEPDAVQRINRSNGAAPNGTANMTLDSSVDYIGANKFILRTPPIIRKAGTYGAIEFGILLYVAGQANPITANMKISRVVVVKALF